MFRNTITIVGLILISIVIFSYFSFKKQPETIYQQSDRIESEEKIIKFGEKNLTVEIADTPHKQSLGLSNREFLDKNRGMLFVFRQPLIPAFWMKDMKFQLDIIWVDENSTITEITKNISPDTFPETFTSSSPIKYVLEVSAGWSDKNKIKVGDKMIGY